MCNRSIARVPLLKFVKSELKAQLDFYTTLVSFCSNDDTLLWFNNNVTFWNDFIDSDVYQCPEYVTITDGGGIEIIRTIIGAKSGWSVPPEYENDIESIHPLRTYNYIPDGERFVKKPPVVAPRGSTPEPDMMKGNDNTDTVIGNDNTKRTTAPVSLSSTPSSSSSSTPSLKPSSSSSMSSPSSTPASSAASVLVDAPSSSSTLSSPSPSSALVDASSPPDVAHHGEIEQGSIAMAPSSTDAYQLVVHQPAPAQQQPQPVMQFNPGMPMFGQAGGPFGGQFGGPFGGSAFGGYPFGGQHSGNPFDRQLMLPQNMQHMATLMSPPSLAPSSSFAPPAFVLPPREQDQASQALMNATTDKFITVAQVKNLDRVWYDRTVLKFNITEDDLNDMNKHVFVATGVCLSIHCACYLYCLYIVTRTLNCSLALFVLPHIVVCVKLYSGETTLGLHGRLAQSTTSTNSERRTLALCGCRCYHLTIR